MAAPSGRGRRGGTAGGTSAVPADAARTRRRVRRDAPMGIARRPTGELGPATSDGSRWSCLCGKALARDDDQRVQDRAGALRIELPPRSRRAPPLEGESEQKGKSKEREQLKQRHPRVRAIEVRPIGAGHAVTLCGIGARIEGPRAAWPCENHLTKPPVQSAPANSSLRTRLRKRVLFRSTMRHPVPVRQSGRLPLGRSERSAWDGPINEARPLPGYYPRR